MNKRLIAIALIIALASVGFVAADEAGVITINFVNSNSRVVTNVSNSTLQAQTNFTNSQATENITLTNSTLTLNVNGQTIVISSVGGNLVVSAPSQNGSLSSETLPLVPLNITKPPDWIKVEQIGDFNILGVTTTPDTYTFFIEVYGTEYFSEVNHLLSENTTHVFPTAFYYDFGLLPNAKFIPSGGFVCIGSGASINLNETENNPGENLELALCTNPNHQSNTYLPDTYDNSGEQYLVETIAYYLAQYLQNS